VQCSQECLSLVEGEGRLSLCSINQVASFNVKSTFSTEGRCIPLNRALCSWASKGSRACKQGLLLSSSHFPFLLSRPCLHTILAKRNKAILAENMVATDSVLRSAWQRCLCLSCRFCRHCSDPRLNPTTGRLERT